MQKLGEEYYTFVRIKFNLILPRLFLFSQAVGLEPNRLAIYVRPMVVSALLIFNKFFWRYSPEFAGPRWISGLAILSIQRFALHGAATAAAVRHGADLASYEMSSCIPVWYLCSVRLPHYP